MTPYVLVDTEKKGVCVPQDHIEDNTITLDITPIAIKNLVISQDGIQFQARFTVGVITHIQIPINAIIKLYSSEKPEENIHFDMEDDDGDGGEEGNQSGSDDDGNDDHTPPPKQPIKGPPHLRIVK